MKDLFSISRFGGLFLIVLKSVFLQFKKSTLLLGVHYNSMSGFRHSLKKVVYYPRTKYMKKKFKDT